MGYLKGGLIIGTLFVLLCFLGYGVVYRKLCKGRKKLPFPRLLWWGILIAYFGVVVGVTLLLRGSYYGYANDVIHPLFYSYREAWIHWSAAAWRNIIFNFCMFVPLGIWLPVGFKAFRKFWRTYLAGFMVTLLIETVQLVTHRGIFEWDDVLGNTVGTMIGYGMFAAGYLLWYAASRRKRGRGFSVANVLATQIPLVLTILGFAVIWGIYERQELGNNPNGYVEAIDKSFIAMTGRDNFSNAEMQLPVYRVQTLTVQETREKGEEILANLNAEVDEGRTIVYDNTLVLYSQPSRYTLWLTYQGGEYDLTDFDVTFPEEGECGGAVEGAEEEIIREALRDIGIYVPEGTSFTEYHPGGYRFDADMLAYQGIKLNGALTCEYYGEAGIAHVKNSIISCMPYKEFLAISEQEAYEKIENGEFSYPQGTEAAIEVQSCGIKYSIDSKGFYQPDYCFDCMINGKAGEIRIPALKGNSK